MNWTPNKLIAAVIGFVYPPIGMLYVVRKWLALLYFIIPLAFITTIYIFFPKLIGSNLEWGGFFIAVTGSIHSYHLAKKTEIVRPWFSKWYGLFPVVLIIFTPIIVTRVFFYQPFRVPSSAMEPTLPTNVILIANKNGCGNYLWFGYTIHKSKKTDSCKIERGDVVVFQYPRSPEIIYIKRVVGIGGDEITYKNKILSINSEATEHNLVKDKDPKFIFEESISNKAYQIMLTRYKNDREGTWKVPEDHYFVLGDNRDNSADSRHWGFVPEANIVGTLGYVFDY